MSVVVPLIDLDAKRVALIQSLLNLQPKDLLAEEQKKWGRKTHLPPKPSFPFFKVTEDNRAVSLPFGFARKLLGRNNLEIDHWRVIVTSGEAGNFTFRAQLREFQVPVALEAWSQLREHQTTTLAVYPGFGKTIIGTWLWYHIGLAGVILVHRETLMTQWLTTIQKCCPELAPYVWMVEDQIPSQPPPIIICMDTRISKVPVGWRRYYGTLIVDECHLFCCPGKITTLLAFEPRYIIAESATPDRDDGMNQMMIALAGTHRVERISSEPYTFVQLETGILAPEVRGKQGVQFSTLCTALSKDAARNLIVADIIRTNPHRKFIILTRIADQHVPLLQQLFVSLGIDHDVLYAHKKHYRDSQVLIGTLSKIGTGFDEENACADFKGRKADCLILMHSIKQRAPFEQARGRVMRAKAPVIVWFNDRNSAPRRHLRGLRGWIQTTNGRIQEVYYTPGGVHLPAV